MENENIDELFDLNFMEFHDFFRAEEELKKIKFRCVCLNIRSLRKNWDTFVASICPILKLIEVIVLVEINIRMEENDLYSLDGFCSEFVNREKRKGGGIAMYIKNSMNYERLKVETLSYENLTVKFMTGTSCKDRIVSGIYRPPNLNENEFIDELGNIINLRGASNDITILGDMNINIRDSTKNHVLKYQEFIASNGMHNVIKEATRIDLSVGSCTLIDHILVNLPESKLFSAIVESNISDHYTTMFGIYDACPEEDVKTSRSFLSTAKVNETIRATDWSTLLDKTDVEDLYSALVEKMGEIYNNSIVLCKKNTQRKKTEWITRDVVEYCKERDRLYRRWKNNRANVSYEIEYKRVRNQINKKINSCKDLYYKKKFEEVKGDPKKTWTLINEILGRKKPSLDDTIEKNFGPNRNIATLSDEFAQLFSLQATSIIHFCTTATSRHQNTIIRDSIYVGDVSYMEIADLICRLNIRKSPGTDCIRASDLKTHIDIFAPIITNIINISLNTSTVPKKLKQAMVRPIYKGGSKNETTNYRPIAILPTIEKILEQIVVERIRSFIDKHKLISKNQYGFQKGKSTNQLIGDFANLINSSLNKSHHVLVLFLDFSKAFDTLNHNKLVDALERVGIRGKLADWLRNYLTERTFRVRIKNSCSTEQIVQYGVPQGSKLGPLLFILYTNELLKCLKNSCTFAYADDTAIVVCHRSIVEAEKIMQAEFHEAAKWCHDNGLVINGSKTKLMHIRSVQHAASEIKIKTFNCTDPDNCETIEVVDTYKYLGITVDSHFLWDVHINNLRKTLKGSLFALACLKYKSSRCIQKQVYHALIESRLRYGILAWGGAAQTHIDKIQSIQNQAIKLLSTRNTAEGRVKVLNVRQIFELTAAMEYYDDQRFRTPISHNFNTRRRADGLYQLPFFNNVYGKRQLIYTMPNILNNLPNGLRNIVQINLRKRRLKEHFLESIT